MLKHGCHKSARRRLVSRRNMPATRNEGCRHMDVAKCQDCHAKWRPATGDRRATGDPRAQREPTQCCKCQTCHLKVTWMSPHATPATQKQRATQSVAARRATNRTQACGQSQPSAVSVTPATQNKGRCHQSPLLPRIKPTWMSPSACPEEEKDVAKCHVQRRRRARTSLVAVRCPDRLWQ